MEILWVLVFSHFIERGTEKRDYDIQMSRTMNSPNSQKFEFSSKYLPAMRSFKLCAGGRVGNYLQIVKVDGS